MHRILKAASIQRSNLYYSTYAKPCSLGNGRSLLSDPPQPFIYHLPFRNFTTEELGTTVNRAIQKKRKPRSKKKYAELVEVNENCTNLTKAVVKKLSANNVSQLSKESELSLEQFHKLLSKKKRKSSNGAKTAFSQSAQSLHENVDLVDNLVSAEKAQDLVQNEYLGIPAEGSVFEESHDHNDVLDGIILPSINEDMLQNKFEGEEECSVIEHDTRNVGMLSKEQISSLTIEDISEAMRSSVESNEPGNVNKISEDVPQKKSKKQKKNRLRDDPSVPINFVDLFPDRLKKMKVREPVRIQKMNENLNSYIEMCVQCDLLNLAFGTINRYVRLQLLKLRRSFINGPRAFNHLMHGFASKANMDKVEILLTMMSSCKIKRSPQTYAACFECLGRSPSTPDNEKKLKKLHEELIADGFDFTDLMNRCKYVRDQRDLVLKVIRILDPTYTWTHPEPPLGYSVPILRELNVNSSPYRSPADQLFTDEQLKQWANEQVNIEMQYKAKIDSVLKPSIITAKTQRFRNEWEKLTCTWRQTLRNGFVKNLKLLETQLINTKSCYNVNAFPYLRVLPPEIYVDIMLDEIHRLLLGSLSYSSTIVSLHRCLGKQVKQRYDIKYREHSGYINKLNKMYKDYLIWYSHPETNPSSHNPRHQWQKLMNDAIVYGPTLDELCKAWPQTILQDVGKFLYDTIIKFTEVNTNCLKKSAKPNWQRAFYSLYRYQSLHLFEEVRPNTFLHGLYRETQPDHIDFTVDLLPMVSPPRPWSSMKNGGYLFTKTDLIRLIECSTRSPDNPNYSRPAHHMFGVFDSLNQLSSVPWKINKPILDIVMKVFKEGGSLPLKIPLSSTKFVQIEKQKKTKEVQFQEAHQFAQRKREMYALWVECLYRLSLANHFRDRTFWLPHNLDFRGRVYPVPPHLSHVGNDLARSLLVFAKGEKLGPRGLDWLKIHCVNLTGLKKREPQHERLRYAEEILPDILDSAEKPLTGKMWWIQSEDMWQTLACCMEIKAAIESGDAENYVCHFPVHQDGSCNGLQHYAALGRDAEGGRSVNLIPCDMPQDVYSCVVEKVEAQRALDAARGKEIAKALEGFIKRKVIKQTVMTTVYGVTHFGARMQIAKQLKATPDLPKHVIWPGSAYLVTSTFNALRTMFTSTRQIQDWLVDCARYLTKYKSEFVQWETPLGLLAIQPYSKSGSESNLYARSGGAVLVPHVIKQKNAFPPNYIHSLDSSHMMLTSLQMERRGATFVSVHDCFWTHPSQVEVMNKICREEFVKLHSLPLLEDMSAFFISNFERNWQRNGDEEVLEKVPPKGSLVLEDVLKSTYFFS